MALCARDEHGAFAAKGSDGNGKNPTRLVVRTSFGTRRHTTGVAPAAGNMHTLRPAGERSASRAYFQKNRAEHVAGQAFSASALPSASLAQGTTSGERSDVPYSWVNAQPPSACKAGAVFQGMRSRLVRHAFFICQFQGSQGIARFRVEPQANKRSPRRAGRTVGLPYVLPSSSVSLVHLFMGIFC